MDITLICDNPNSWIIPYMEQLEQRLMKAGHICHSLHDYQLISSGDVCVFLSCEKIAHEKVLELNHFNLVVHESSLPEGKGWSPLSWQILEGKNRIPVTLIEAAKNVDSGKIYAQKWLEFDGSELLKEMKKEQGELTIDLIFDFIQNPGNFPGKQQTGTESFYRRRTSGDSELDTNKTIVELFNLLRIVDNERYPAYFHHMGHKYILKIEKADN